MYAQYSGLWVLFSINQIINNFNRTQMNKLDADDADRTDLHWRIKEDADERRWVWWNTDDADGTDLHRFQFQRL